MIIVHRAAHHTVASSKKYWNTSKSASILSARWSTVFKRSSTFVMSINVKLKTASFAPRWKSVIITTLMKMRNWRVHSWKWHQTIFHVGGAKTAGQVASLWETERDPQQIRANGWLSITVNVLIGFYSVNMHTKILLLCWSGCKRVIMQWQRIRKSLANWVNGTFYNQLTGTMYLILIKASGPPLRSNASNVSCINAPTFSRFCCE